MSKIKNTPVREIGTVISYNGYEGEIKNVKGSYDLLRDNVYGKDRDNITINSKVEFTPRENICNTGHKFVIAENITIIGKEQEINSAKVRIFKPRAKRR